jgi:hypothetical protein
MVRSACVSLSSFSHVSFSDISASISNWRWKAADSFSNQPHSSASQQLVCSPILDCWL